MASASSSSVASGGAAQHIDVDVEDDARAGSSSEALDEDMAGDATPAADDAETPQSTHTTGLQDGSDAATPFYQNNSNKKQSSSSRLTDTAHDEDDDMMEPTLPGVEGRFLDEKIRARYIQEIGDIFG
ncbi:hypothetical protein PSEUBRA_002597 [Kalmanozyma brasiliensis GHG001]|uniref:Uncharacterized protein n=1 Tax=Kalmanozyma brasiliensis (strain GHG001) TaxID=1365824 RepID=V5GNI3_KALBG|nr:uncharacterized protein PSEUBRA_002597 [Kalmanozyma brasiliensis GHG001]EST07517.1 hypothetical protein PSEUBRA_002597 [Kalmanozyma brasiliensis GHG001]